MATSLCWRTHSARTNETAYIALQLSKRVAATKGDF